MTRPLISAVMPVFNSADTIERAITSVLSQTYENLELIITDDGSTDDIQLILSSIKDERLRCYRFETNQGRAAARNKCIEMANGEFIAVCDGDDISTEDRFQVQVAALLEDATLGVIASQMLYFSENSAPYQRVKYPESSKDIAARFGRGQMAVPHASAMFRRELVDRFGGYALECYRAQDFEWFMRMRSDVKFRVLPEVLVHYNDDTGNLSLEAWWERRVFHRYALHHSSSVRDGEAPLSLKDFSSKWSTRLQIYGVDTCRYMRYRVVHRGRVERTIR